MSTSLLSPLEKGHSTCWVDLTNFPDGSLPLMATEHDLLVVDANGVHYSYMWGQDAECTELHFPCKNKDLSILIAEYILTKSPSGQALLDAGFLFLGGDKLPEIE